MNTAESTETRAAFKTSLISFAKTAVQRSERVTNEEATKQYLVLPFFQLLGYDPLNPDEIIPEAEASFAEKFRNKVDYAICAGGQPVIAVECKKTGELNDGHRGELKGYFNAVQTTKLGILTDGLLFELFSDTDSENMMDAEPFVTLNLRDVARERVNDQVLDALLRLRKGTFDPADVGADARRRIFVAKYTEVLDSNFSEPTEDFQRALMDLAAVEGRRTARMMEDHLPIVREALRHFLDRKILERVGFASRQDLVRTSATAQAATTATLQAEEPVAVDADADQEPDDGIITTETELAVFDHVRTRLAFLVRDEDLFSKLRDLQWVDFKTRFVVFYKQARKGRIFSFKEGPGGEMRFDFHDGKDPVVVADLHQLDDRLLEIYRMRVGELDG
jgi:predicted type IV restriction endonuclease